MGCLRATFRPHELFLLFTDLWTSWAPLATDGLMELPSEPQPIMSCSCSQKAPSSCGSRSGPEVPGPTHNCWEFNPGNACPQGQHAGILWGQRVSSASELSVFSQPAACPTSVPGPQSLKACVGDVLLVRSRGCLDRVEQTLRKEVLHHIP